MVWVEGASNRLGLACNQAPGGRGQRNGENPSSVNRNFHSMGAGGAGSSTGTEVGSCPVSGLTAIGAAQLWAIVASRLAPAVERATLLSGWKPSAVHLLLLCLLQSN